LEQKTGIISWIGVGVIAGWLVGKIMKGKGFGLVVNVLIGEVNALVGGWLAGVYVGDTNQKLPDFDEKIPNYVD
jgi:uncharacterized membrane protein YeaQ/YmgE (transglycosylase-associated protein family)